MPDKKILPRPPRIQPHLPIDEIEVPGPPDEMQNQQAILELFLPLIMVLGYVFLAFSGRGRSVVFIIPMSLAMVFSVVFGLRRFIMARREAEEQKKAYSQKLAELRHDMEGYHREQSDFYYYNYPNPSLLLDIAKKANKSRIGPRVWERRTTDSDFGLIRLGIGTINSTVIYKLSGGTDTASELLDDAQRLCDDSLYLFDVPVTINLRMAPQGPAGEDDEDQQPTTQAASLNQTVRHSVGIFPDNISFAKLSGGTSRLNKTHTSHRAVYQYSYALLSQFTLFHSYTDTELYVIGSQRVKNRWEWMENLPHVRLSDQATRMAFEPEGRSVDGDASREDSDLTILLKQIRGTLLTRQQRANESKGLDVTLPFILLVVDMMEVPTHSTLRDVETLPTISLIMEKGLELGAAVIFLVDRPEQIPGDCQAVIELQQIAAPPDGDQDDEQGYTVAFRYAETELNTVRYVGIADAVKQLNADLIAQEIAEYEIRLSAAASLATEVDLLLTHRVGSLKELNILDKWQKTRLGGEWPSVPIGLQAGNETCYITFDAKVSGVHGMIAGTTGSGKTELLRALIIGLAINYDPTAVNFLLVDFKGGAGFSDFADLPHCIESVSNLSDSAVERVFASIRAELDRRSRIIAEAEEIEHIVDYRRGRLTKPGDVARYAFPHLFIIIDEFAEMIQDNTEYRAQLDSITRLGRALGVSLVLASQRPGSSVTDQMGANIKFRICMRVENPEDSREVIRTSDAAYLPVGVAGRGYYRVGNEVPELIQVAYASKSYIDAEQGEQLRIIWVNDESEEDEPIVEKPMYRILIETMQRLVSDHGLLTLDKTWPDPIPIYLPLDEPRDTLYLRKTEEEDEAAATIQNYLNANSIGHSRNLIPLNANVMRWQQTNEQTWDQNIWQHPDLRLKTAVGVIDNPARARQHLLMVDLPTDRHVIIFGASGWGKTLFLQTVMVGLAANHSPRDLHLYILDFGGRRLTLFQNLPHVGAHIPVDEADRVERLLIILSNFLEERKTAILSNSSYNNLVQYNQHVEQEKRFPAIVVALDNFVEFRENFEEQIPRLITLLREGPDLGIHFVVTAGLPNEINSKVYNLFPKKLALTLADAGEYSTVVGRGAPILPEVVGRGVIRVNRELSRVPLEFQVALPVGLPLSEREDIRRQLDTQQHASVITQEKYLARLETRSVELLTDLFARMNAESDRLEIDLSEKANRVIIPDAISLLALLEVEDIDEIDVLGDWEHSRGHPEWPRVKIGEGAQGPTEIIFDAKYSGVHGVIAGTTGSGKSELLLTVIAGLALKYDPSAVNFLLVDYKGGTAFDKFRELPHCIELVTNLDARAVERVFASIRAELDRRGQIIANFKVDHIVQYNRLRLAGRLRGDSTQTIEPLPHLFIIVDEFAEMIQDYPEYKAQLESITRLGRALGVSLILAAQRPQGKISDQMRSNMKFRICLRVESPEDSREMLRRVDAAHLPNDKPGRAYYQVGNTPPDLIQVAQAGADYSPRSERMVDFIVDLAKQAQALDRPDEMTETTEIEMIDFKLSSVMVDWIAYLAQEHADVVKLQAKGWPDPLPAYLPLTGRINTRYLPHTERYSERAFLRGLNPQQPAHELALNEALRAWEDGHGAWHDNIWQSEYALNAVFGL
ncbi:MAG: hypothetical protein JXA10_10715, partial [Anaerolineae bacterium]|nr:hypothetical protein [Anaerolineae bacterium]